MNRYGVKFFPDDLNIDNIDIMHKVLNNNNTIELSIYKDTKIEEDTFKKMSLHNFNKKQIIYHADYNKASFSLYKNYNKGVNIFISELQVSEKLNASKMVIHLDHQAPFPINNKQSKKYFVNEIIKMFEDIYNTYPNAKNTTICIENIYADLFFYKEIIEKLKDKNFNIGFTFDIGHAKVWGNNNLKEYIEVIKILRAKEIPIHCHLHTNQGDIDSHTPFYKGVGLPYLNESITGEIFTNDIIKEVKELHNLFKKDEEVTFTLEVNIKDALQDYELLTGQKI